MITLIFKHRNAVLFLLFAKAVMDTDLVSQLHRGFYSKAIFSKGKTP